MRQRETNPRLYSDLTSFEIDECLDGTTLIWPCGTIEQHGPHLPLSVDVDISEAMAFQVSREVDGYVLPPLIYGARSLPQSGGGLSFAGTLYSHGSILVEYLESILASIACLPIKRLILLNGHFENEPFLFEALDTLSEGAVLKGIDVVAFSWWSVVEEAWVRDNLPRFPGWHAEHAGETETSLMLFLRPELVRPPRPVHDRIPKAGIYRNPIDANVATTQGVLSSTSGATAELGEALFWHVIDRTLVLLD